ncbi:MAG: hypothetical protein RIE56_13385 [Amphiplicatus sp.]
MLRIESPAAQANSGGKNEFTLRSGSRRALFAGFVVAAIASNGVAADTLAQPRDTALERRAADYVQFREDVSVIEATPFDSAKTTREAHVRLSAHDSTALSGGWVAYAALVAADTPAFAEALQDEVSAKTDRKTGLSGRDAFFAKLAADPTYARKLPGAKDAVQRVLAMTAQDAARYTTLGEAFKTQAYAMQRTSWGKQKIPSSQERLSEAAKYAKSRPAATTPVLQAATKGGVTAPMLASVDRAWSPDWGAEGSAKANPEQNAQVVLDRVLNLAARYAVGGVNEKIVDVYAKNDRADQCLSMNTLTLRQCIAATRAPYEEAFCLGEHALNDVAKCIGWVAGAGAS